MERILVFGLTSLLLLGTGCSDDTEPVKVDLLVGDSRPAGSDNKLDGIHCGEVAFKITRTIPDMLIVLDRSNSMGSAVPPLWDTSRNAVYEITAAIDTQIWFGLFTFPGPLCTGGNDLAKDCSAPTEPTVPLEAGAAAAIKTALTPMKVCGGTPTAQTLLSAGQYLKTKLPVNQHTRYILLATDGGPDCNPALNISTCTCTPGGSCVVPENCLDDVRTNQVLKDLCAAGIKTFVVGLGPVQLKTDVLQAMAQHGCTGKPYTPADPAAIKKTFADIAAGVATCTFEMDCTKIPDPGLVNFYFDALLVPRSFSHSSGWDWVVPCKATGTGKVEFFGADCDAIKASRVKTVAATFGCATKIE